MEMRKERIKRTRDGEKETNKGKDKKRRGGRRARDNKIVRRERWRRWRRQRRGRAKGEGRGRGREETRRAEEEEDEAADAVLNHVIVERFNWSGA